jgi:phenylacetate-CoA ligase
MNFKVVATGAATLIVKRYVGPFWVRRKWLKKTQWLSSAELEEVQLHLLKRLVRHCYNTVPYYRNFMDDRLLRVEDIRTLGDIGHFPILTKEKVLQARGSFVSTKYPKWMTRTVHTGGTSGTPMLLQRNLFAIANEHAFVRRQWDWAGVGLRDKCAYLTGRLIVKPDQKNGRLYAYDPIMKELILSTYHLSRRTAEEYAAVIENYGARAIVGYPSAVYLLAQTCLDSGIRLTFKSVLTSSETLTESMRSTIAEAFECKVFDFYGSAERVCYIFTCEHGHYHIIPEYGLTELIPIDGPDDKRHRIVSTGFWNMAMPLIRYDMGDVVLKSNDICPCGREFRVIESISGREADIVKTPSGRQFGAAILTHLLYGTNNIVESQIIQDALEHITIEYVPGERFSAVDRSNLETLVTRHLPSELKVDLREVEAVKRTQSGKIRPVVSQIMPLDHLQESTNEG